MSDESAADAGSIPRLRPHFRFQWEPAQDAYVLLYPEGMIKLNGSAGEIMASIDGERSVEEIVATLERKFPEAGDLRADIVEFLSVAHDKRWIEFS